MFFLNSGSVAQRRLTTMESPGVARLQNEIDRKSSELERKSGTKNDMKRPQNMFQPSNIGIIERGVPQAYVRARASSATLCSVQAFKGLSLHFLY